MAKKRKKRKLRKPVKAVLYLSLGTIIQSVLPKQTLSTLFGSPVITVHAETNINQTVKTIATIKNDDLTDKKTLKNYVVNQYSAIKKEKLDEDKTTVLMDAPAVVTAPTISNVNFTVITEKEKKELPAAIRQAQMQSQLEVPQSLANKMNKASGDPVAGNGTAQQQNEIMSSDTETKTDNKSEPASPSKPTKLENDLSVSTDKPLVIDSSNNLVNLDNETKKDNSTTENGLNITLKTDYVLIDDGSMFNPADYIGKMTSKADGLPALKVDNPVDPTKSGEYTVTYTVVDSNGKTASAQLTVEIDLTEQVKQMQEERKKQNAETQLQKFVDETLGTHIDEDGFYNDQCWDLWAYFNRTRGLYGFDYSTQPYGYVNGIPLKYNRSGASTYYDYIQPNSNLQTGDWLFWDQGSSCPDSHVALLLGINEDGMYRCLTQTEGEGTTIKNIQPDIMAAFRLKPANDWSTFCK